MFKKEKIIRTGKILFSVCGEWTGLMSGGLTVPFTIAALYYQGHNRRLFVILAFVALAIFAIRAVWRNYQLQEKLRANQLTGLFIDGISSAITTSNRHQCQIRVSSVKTADNVQVEIFDMEDELAEVGKFIHPTFPIILKPEIAGINTINPGSSQKYNLFQVGKSDGAKRIGNELFPDKNFVCYFTEEATKDVALFRGKKHYHIKIVATARDLPKTEQGFFVRFSRNDDDFWRFNLIPVTPSSEKEAREFNRALVVATLGQFRLDLLGRAKQIIKISSNQYHDENKEGDDASARIFNEITSYFGQNAIDLGTNALADFQSKQNMDRTPIHDNFGETIYHDDWQWMQQWLIQSEKNLTKIIDKLNAKPL
jgi:hypothetical protein